MTEKYVPTTNSFEFQNEIVGVLQSLLSGEADVVLGGVESRARWIWVDYIDSTVSYFSRRIRWYVPCAFKRPRWSSIFRIFTRQLWFSLIMSLILLTIALTLVARRGRNSEVEVYRNVTSTSMSVWAVMLGATAAALPRTAPVRVTLLSWLFFSLAINAVFQSFLTAFLTEPGYERPIENIDQMLDSEIKYGYYPLFDDVYLVSGDANSGTILRNRIKCPVFQVCLKWAYMYKNISLILDELSVEERFSSSSLMDENARPLICSLEDGIIMYVNNVMMLHKGDPRLERINDIIQKVVEAGIFMQWKTSHFESMKIRAGAIRVYSPLSNFYGFNIKHVTPAFCLLLIGFGVSILMFILELAFYRI